MGKFAEQIDFENEMRNGQKCVNLYEDTYIYINTAKHKHRIVYSSYLQNMAIFCPY